MMRDLLRMRRPNNHGKASNLKDAYRSFFYWYRDIINYGCFKTDLVYHLNIAYNKFVEEYRQMPLQTQKHWVERYNLVTLMFEFIIENKA